MSSGPRLPWAEYERRATNQRRPPVDMPPDYAITRSDGAIRQWDGKLWRWNEGARSWHLIDDLI